MKQIVILMLALFTTMGLSAQTKKQSNPKATTTKTAKKQSTTQSTTGKVFITNAKGATAYHKTKNCQYLRKSTDVQSLTAAQAKKKGRVTCKSCYPETKTTKTKTTKKTTTSNKKQAGQAIEKQQKR